MNTPPQIPNQIAVKAVFFNHEIPGKVLIVKQSEPRVSWQAIGGRLEPGEKLHDGLAREIIEETDLTLEQFVIGDMVNADEWFGKPEGKLVHIVAIFFAVEALVKHISLPINPDLGRPEHTEYGWFTPDEMKELGAEPEIVAAAQKALALTEIK